MAAKSFKQMIKDGDLKRADAMKARLEDLHEEPGFNLRAEGEDSSRASRIWPTTCTRAASFRPLKCGPAKKAACGLSTGTAAGALT